MYQEAEEQINEGFSPVARILLGVVSGVFGIMVIGIAPDTNKQIYYYLFGGFCLAICLACVFKGRVRQFIGGIIGVFLIILSLGYMASKIISGGPLFSSRSEQLIFNAILFLVFFGLPGLSYAIKEKFGFSQ